MTELTASTSRPSLLRLLRYYLDDFLASHVNRNSSSVDPLVKVEFLVDMAAFLGPHTQDRFEKGSNVAMMWPVDCDFNLQSNPSNILVSLISIAQTPVTSAIYWRWTPSQRRITHCDVSFYNDDPRGLSNSPRSLPKSCHTLDDALAWLETLGITADPLHARCAIVPDR